MATDTTMTIGAAARAAGVNVQTLHYYERRGLLEPRRRSGSSYREYAAAEVARVRAIKRAQSLGFTLAELGELFDLAGGTRDRQRVMEIAAAKLAEIESKLHDLARVRGELSRLLETCSCAGDLTRCSVLDGLGDAPAAAGARS